MPNLTFEEKLKEFHLKYGHLISEVPTINIPEKVKDLRIKLIEEEWEEMRRGLFNDDLVEIADGAADLIYVIIGTCVSYGIPITRIFNEVHNSNMTKTAVKAVDGQKYGTTNPKGPDYRPPDIETILKFPDQMTTLESLNY